MGDSNVFNTFSFNKWADNKKEEEIDKESRRRRTHQIKRLKERLAKERQMREAGGDGDMDIEALIEALQKGEEINEDQAPMNEPEPMTVQSILGPDRSDDDILSEIRRYQDTHHGPPEVMGGNDPRFWKYNRRLNELMPEEEPEAPKRATFSQKQRPPTPTDSFKYNRYVTKT